MVAPDIPKSVPIMSYPSMEVLLYLQKNHQCKNHHHNKNYVIIGKKHAFKKGLFYTKILFFLCFLWISRGYFEKLRSDFYSKVAMFCVKMGPFCAIRVPSSGPDAGSGLLPVLEYKNLVPVFQNYSGYLPVFWVSGTLIDH